jgi:hypothetical protein
MKREISSVLVAAGLAILAGCSGNTSVPSTEEACQKTCSCDTTGTCVEACLKVVSAAKTSEDMDCLLCRDSVVNCELAVGPNGYQKCLPLCVKEPLEPVPDVPAEVAEVVEDVPAVCPACLKPGLAFRLTKLDVKQPSEPPALKDFLNAIWAPDVCDQRLNIVLRLDTVEDAGKGDGSLNVKFTAGSGWPCPGGVDKLPIDMVAVKDCGDPSIVQYDEFCFVPGGTTTFDAIIDKNCHFVTQGAANLNFHPGRVDHAYICSAGDEKLGLNRDTIPLANLQAYGDFNQECSEVVAGNLAGCIAKEAADQICSFLAAPNYKNWDMDHKKADACDPGVIPDGIECNGSAYYCMKACNESGWANFGGFAFDTGVPFECTVGNAGAPNAFKLSGDFTASKITVH